MTNKLTADQFYPIEIQEYRKRGSLLNIDFTLPELQITNDRTLTLRLDNCKYFS